MNGKIVRPVRASSIKKEKINGIDSVLNILEEKRKIKTQLGLIKRIGASLLSFESDFFLRFL